MKAKYYLRYMDDMLILGDKPMLCKIKDKSIGWLMDELKLSLKNEGQINQTAKGIGFLGSVIYPGFIKMSSSSKKRIRSRFKKYERYYQKGWINEIDLQQRITALWAGLYHANSYGWRKNLAKECMDI